MTRSSFEINELFNIEQFAHKNIFLGVDYVWNVLDQLVSYLDTCELGLHKGEISPQAYLINPELISIGKGTIVEPGAYIQGPCIIGDHCTIRHGAYIRGNVITGDHCVIGHCTEVKSSLFLNHAHAAHFAYVGDSILGNHVNLGAGVKLANLLFNKKNIKIKINDQQIDTGKRKLGSILGDHSQLGCNAVANPGTILGKKACVYPCINVAGFIPEEHSVRANNEITSNPPKNYAFS